jgi:hypothetical protein
MKTSSSVDNSAIQQFSKSANQHFADKVNLILQGKSCQQFSKSVSYKQIVSAILSFEQSIFCRRQHD